MISIIIPCLNEEEIIEEHINYLLPQINNDCEIIIVDGGSTDSTIDIINKFSEIKIYHSPIQSRAAQMNLGAQSARGDILYFLHTDSFPPKDFVSIIRGETSTGVDLGNFSVKFNPSTTLLKINEWVTRQPYLYTGGGDQSLFIKKEIFNNLCGFDERYVIMEEYDFLSRAQKKYNFKLITNRAVTTSSRKYIKNNYLKIQLVNLYIMILYSRNVSPKILKEKYNRLLNW